MSGEISSTSPSRPTAPVTEAPPPNDQAAVDQAQKNQQAQQAQAAEQTKLEQMAQKTEKPQGLSSEFLNAFSTVVHEGFENYRVPQGSASSGAYGDGKGQEMQKELQVLREFLREANRMVLVQKMEIPQMLNMLKVQQGGAFWNKLQQILAKGIPGHQAVLFQRLDKDAGDIKHKFGSPEIPAGGEKAGEALKATGNPAGQALAEMLKAESNPTTQIEHMILALQILNREGLKDSSQKLLGYLKHRWGMSDEELRRFLSEHNLPYYLGPMPKKDRDEKAQGTFWYPVLALVAVPIGMLAGMDFLWASVLGIALLGFLLILTAQRKN
ncbi:MAG: hypothetical protein IT572_08055 [Deltaproteobacteria bacterium]|nr:hypothetical protein [Deltaproteobacteria bacterium]